MNASEPALALTGVRKSYGPVTAVRGVDLRIEPGEIVALLGPNGAGKSTLNEMILGLIRPDAGRVRVFGSDPLTAVRDGRVGAMLQAGALLSDCTVRELLGLMHGLYAHPLPLDEVIERAELAGFLKTRTERLSGGQAQRVRYALALLPDPELMILDEPTVAMDVELRRRFWTSMRDVTAGDRTVLFATHYLEEADQAADRIVVLAAGSVVADGSGDMIKSRVSGKIIGLAADPALDLELISALPGVVRVARVGARLELTCDDSDRALRALLERQPAAREIEVTAASLEDAFLALTTEERVA
ncbi:ABC transporter ATP-binding protein [Microlunatus parietis]|uniref:ABC-2 type transport system ATP-binding protein n=1 Tax=Microlunatus parietis TaxID=682979 RepID=A0A7Y9I6U5_9ACTN|nr:ABC transporter ATP-binding protein [Microlunatus parietis]NYE71198.1 ABC-2 type transport system ATP-binding protein [Microlunatus parietis]